MGAKTGFKTPAKKPSKWGSQWVAGLERRSEPELRVRRCHIAGTKAAPDTLAQGENVARGSKGLLQEPKRIEGLVGQVGWKREDEGTRQGGILHLEH